MACAGNKGLKVVEYLDINKYTGTWYEIARIPNSFERNLDNVSATYTLKENGRIQVYNKGYLIKNRNKLKEIKGEAWIPDKDCPAKLKVRFFWPFYGKYWVLSLGENYQYALVGNPSRKYLWILSRTKQLNAEIYKNLLEQAKNQGFDISKIIKVNHTL